MNRLFFCILLSVLGSLLAAATWTGSVSTSWNNASNWNPASVPTSAIDVTVPNVTNKPVINATATCRNLTIQTGSSVTLNSSYNLTVSGIMAVNGALNMSSTGDLYATGNFFWESGSTASITNSSATIIASGNMQFHASSNVQIASGTIQFTGSTATTDLANFSTLTQIFSLYVSKSAGTSFSIRTGSQPFTVNGHISNELSSTFYNYFTGNITLKGNISDYNTDPAYGIKWDNGTLIMDGTGPSIGVRSATCYLKNLTFSQSGTAQLTWPLTLKGKLRIESGVFYPQAHNITLAGDWENVVGPAAFTEGTTARVTFNGTSHQLCNYSETFNILEVNSSAALRVNSSTAVVTCAQYDWTAGGIDVVAGTFTANDLADAGIFGSYWVTPTGTINLTNSDSWVDLNGSMTFTNGGTINVYGGTGTSDWSYGGNASLTMNGPGILDFKNVGINIYNSGTYTLNCSINDFDAEIRTVGSFTCSRSSFAPEQGWLVMYGTTDATLTMNSGTLCSLRINKIATREEESTPQPTFITDARTGISREVTRANTVNLATNVTCTEDLSIDYGTLNLQSYQFNCYITHINSTLRMNNASAKLVSTSDIYWQSNSIADITLGTLETTGTWQAVGNANVVLPAAVETRLVGTAVESIAIQNPNMQFGNLVVGSASPGAGYTLNASSSYNLLVAGNLTITAGNELDMGTFNLTVNGALYLNGKLDIHATTVTVHGKPYLEATSNLTIDNGSFICDESTILPRTTTLKGILSISSGTLNLVHHSLTVNAGSTNTLTSGTIYCDGLTALTAGTFQPAGGTVVLGYQTFGGIAILRASNGNWLPNVTIDGGSYYLGANLIIKGNFTLLSGSLDVQDSTPTIYNITVSGNWSHQGGTFYPRTGRVIFNGTSHQLCNYSETFNIVEVNKSGGALRIDSSSAVVTCAQYDWTAGGIDVLAGTFTANDLADSGIFGSYWVNPGSIINLTNNDSWVDLNGSMTFTNGGTINVYGGTGTSDWSYGGNASLTMNGGGVLDFKNVGINIYDSTTYTFTYSINNPFAEVRTVGSFTCNRSTFNPTSGKVVMYGATDATLTMNAGSLNSLNINKASTREETNLPTQPNTSDKRFGEPREVTRANTVNLGSNVTLTGSFSLQYGVCNLQSYQLSCYDAGITGTLKMNNSSAKLFASYLISWSTGGSADITLGTLETTGQWDVWTGANVILPVAVITNLTGTDAKPLYCSSSSMQFGTLNIGGTATTGGVYTLTGTQNLLVAGNLTITAGNELDMGIRNLIVNGALNLNGKLDIHATTATVQGKPVFATTSNLSIVDGIFTFYDSSIPRDTYMRGILNLTNSTLHAVNNALRFEATSSNTITGGSLIWCDGINATGSGNFQPLGGTVIITANPASSHYNMNVSNGNWLPSLVIGTNTGVILASNLIIKGYLQIESGNLDVSSSNYSITIGGAWENLVGESGFNQRNGRVIFNGSASQQCDYTETFHILELNNADYLFVSSNTAVITCAQYDWTAGSIRVTEGTFTANDLADNGIYGGVYAHGNATINLTNNDSYVDLNGTMYISDTATVNIYGGTTTSDWAFGGNATLNMTGGVLDFKNRGIRIYDSPTYTFTSNIGGGVIRTVGGLEVFRSGFEPWGGTLELYGSTDASLTMYYGNLYNLNINKGVSRDEDNLSQESLMAMDKEGNIRELTRSNTVNLGSNIDIDGNLSIQSGVLNASTQTIYVGGNWSNSVGDSGFLEGQSTVIFDGNLTQYIGSNLNERFYNLTLAKTGAPSDLWQNVGVNVYVDNIMNLNQGYYRANASCHTLVKHLNIQSLACFSTYSQLSVRGDMTDNNTTYGESVGYVQSGVIMFYGSDTQTVSRSGIEFRASNLVIDKTAGTICNFNKPVVTDHNVIINGGIWQDTANNFVHKIGGDISVWSNGAIANDTNNTFTFVGNEDQDIAYAGTGGLTNVIINKSGGFATIFGNLVLTNSGNLTIENGNLYSAGWDITCPGNFTINSSTAAAYIEAGSTLRMGIVRNLNVNAGLLTLAGSVTDPVTITSISGFYNFNVESGATLSAIYTIFEKMTASGVNVKNGALVNTTDPFKNCTFQNGAAGGTLLTLNNNQTLNIDNAVFPANTWSGTNNVKKTMNWGTVNFNLATGAFSGAAFESDTFNRINWLGGNPDLRITSIDWSSNNPYICDAVTATVYVQNNSTTNITTPFRVDLYKNRTTAPPSGTLGDSYITITSLAAGVTTNVTFTNISTDVPGTWTSWFQVDANGLIAESNESNNVWTPAITTTWNALPIVSNLEAERSGSNVQLNWTYPISVYRYKIYKDTNPNGSFGTLAGTSFTPSFSQAFSGTKWFYRVRAERLLP